jgi:drug/metabolite transporter (DMT)-like permease
MREDRIPGTFLVLLSTLAYGTLPILAKVAYARGVRPAPLLAWRFALAAVLFGWLARGAARLPFRRRLRLWGLGAIFLGNALAYFKALETVPASTLALIIYTYPVIVTLLSAMVGLDPLTVRGLAAAVLAAAGCAFTAGAIGGLGPGVLLALLSAFVYATYIILGSRFAADVPAPVAAGHLAQVCAVFCLIWAPRAGGLLLPPDPVAWAAVLAITLVCTVVALYTLLAGLARVGPARTAVVSSFEVVVTMALAVAFLGERLGFRQWFGATLILGAVVLRNLESLRALRPAPGWRRRHP